MPSLAQTQYFNLDWNFGLGGGVGVSTSGGSPGVAVAGIAGLEFNFTKVPIDLTVEYRPAIGLLPGVGIGLIGFTLLPTCPPRLLDASHGFVDTMAQFSSWGWWGGEASAPRGLGGMTNQYAAMPSLHVGFAFAIGIVVLLLVMQI